MDHATSDTLRNNYITAITDGDNKAARTLGRQLNLPRHTITTHLAARHHADTDWLPDEFTNFLALPPGRFDPRVFNQDTWWVDSLRQPHRITDTTDFNDAHLTATIGFLEANAWRWAEPHDYNNPNITTDEWLYTTPLMRALRAELRARTNA